MTLGISTVNNDEDPGALLTCMDVGLTRTYTRVKVFAALKGAMEGGLDIPHSNRGILIMTPSLRARVPRWIEPMSSSGTWLTT